MNEINLENNETPEDDGGPEKLWAFVDVEEVQPNVLLNVREGDKPWQGISLNEERIKALIEFLSALV